MGKFQWRAAQFCNWQRTQSDWVSRRCQSWMATKLIIFSLAAFCLPLTVEWELITDHSHVWAKCESFRHSFFQQQFLTGTASRFRYSHSGTWNYGRYGSTILVRPHNRRHLGGSGAWQHPPTRLFFNWCSLNFEHYFNLFWRFCNGHIW